MKTKSSEVALSAQSRKVPYNNQSTSHFSNMCIHVPYKLHFKSRGSDYYHISLGLRSKEQSLTHSHFLLCFFLVSAFYLTFTFQWMHGKATLG